MNPRQTSSLSGIHFVWTKRDSCSTINRVKYVGELSGYSRTYSPERFKTMLKEYLDCGHSPYHVVSKVTQSLQNAGFKGVSLGDIKELRGGNYYLTVNDTTLFALRIPEGKRKTLRIITAHTDYPCFKIKPVAGMAQCGNCNKINVEKYGGMLARTWFDRPLGISGAIWTRGVDEFNPVMKLVDIDRPVCLIPSLAPHMDREIENRKINEQKELIPVTGLADGRSIMKLISEEAGCDEGDILSYDLNLFNWEKAVVVGNDGELIMGQGIDNIASVAAATQAFTENSNLADDGCVSIMCLFDNEEIGSRTRQGADSTVLARVIDMLNVSIEEGIIISADGAHGVHPNYPEKSDPVATAEMGKGLVIKTSASMRYATEGKTLAIIKGICEERNISYQIQANRSGAPGGSTLGPIVSSHIPIAAADVGIPMLAMHSACECAAMFDYRSLVKFIKAVI